MILATTRRTLLLGLEQPMKRAAGRPQRPFLLPTPLEARGPSVYVQGASLKTGGVDSLRLFKPRAAAAEHGRGVHLNAKERSCMFFVSLDSDAAPPAEQLQVVRGFLDVVRTVLCDPDGATPAARYSMTCLLMAVDDWIVEVVAAPDGHAR